MKNSATLPAKREPQARQHVTRPPLTEREKQVLHLLAQWWDSKGYGASVRDIAAQMPWSHGTVASDMRKLKNKGYVEQPPYTQRSARPVDLNGAA